MAAALAAALLLPVAAQAQDADASLTIISGSTLAADWYGEGAISMRKQLCISSPTARYTLEMSGATSWFPTNNPNVEIRFQDETGASQTKTLGQSGSITFVGNSLAASSDCSTGSNATLEILIPERLLLSQQAGRYFDQILLAVSPL